MIFENKVEDYILTLIVIFICFSLMFSPLICFIVLCGILCLTPMEYIGRIRSILSFFCYFCLIFIIYSKDYNYANAIDYRVYSQANDLIVDMRFWDIFSIFPNEPGWGVIYWVLNNLGLSISGLQQVSFFNTFICILIFFLWFEKHALKEVSYKHQGIVTAATILFLSIVTLGFLQRQSLSVAILLFALSNHYNKKFYFYLFISSLFHNTSLIMGLLYKFIIHVKFDFKKIILLILIFIFFRLFFMKIIIFLNGYDFLSYKSNFYLRIDEFQITSYKLVLIGLFLSFISMLYVNRIDNYFKNVIIFSCICFVSLLGINLASERVNFLLIYCFGFFISIILIRKDIRALIVLNVIMLILFCLEKFGYLNSDLGLWDKYNWYDGIPFYYLGKF